MKAGGKDMKNEAKSVKSATASIAWLESERDKEGGKVKEMVEEPDGLRNVGFKPDTLSRTANIAAPKNARDRFLINEKEIKTESLLYCLS